MPKRSVLTERFRRVSTPDVFRRASRADPPVEPLAETARPTPARAQSVPDTLTSHSASTNLLTLPTELYAQILSLADFPDLCSFRLVCRTTHHLLSSGDIARRWMLEHIDAHQSSLHPPPAPPTFVYLLEQQRRRNAVTETAAVLVEYIEHEILRHTLRRANVYTDQYRQGLFGLVKIRLREKMSPLLFTIQAYLELKAESLLSAPPTPESSNHHDTAIGDPARQSEHAFFTTLDPAHLLQTHKCFLFLTWLSNQILARPSYAGTMERTMRGWLSDPLDAENFRRYFLLGNVGALAQLVRAPSYKHRRRVVEAWMKGLDPEQNVFWRERWEGVGGVFGVGRDAEAVGRVLGGRVGAEDLWVRDAREVLVEKGLLDKAEEVIIGSPWQTMDFLCEIAGYDVLHTPPSWTTAS